MPTTTTLNPPSVILRATLGGEFASEGKEVVHFDFDTNNVSFERNGTDLVIYSENGKTILQNFFVSKNDNLPTFLLENGTEIAGKDFLLTYDPSFDISVAAGPQSPSSGLSNYVDSAGDLLTGVDRMAALKTTNMPLIQNRTSENMLAESRHKTDKAIQDTSERNDPITPPRPENTYNDTINVNAGESNVSMYIHGDMISQQKYNTLKQNGTVLRGGQGDQIITNDGTAFAIIGDDIYTDPSQNLGGRDSITVKAGTFQGEIYGGYDNDTIAVTATVQQAKISGDHKDMSGNSQGGNDSITVTKIGAASDLSGDAVGQMSDNSTGGNDFISVDTLSLWSHIGGDAGSQMKNSAKGGKDTISITSMESGYVGGDAGYSMHDNTAGGNDSVRVTTMEAGYLGGDAGYSMHDNAAGGNDSIRVTTMEAGYLGGDAGYSMHDNAAGGNDSISIDKISQWSYVGGDASKSMENNTTGGNDTITIGVMDVGHVGGDAGATLQDDSRGGNDSIRVTAMKAGFIGGDAGTAMSGNAIGGNDTLGVETMSSGLIGGDAGIDMQGHTTGGNDSLTVGSITGTRREQSYVGGDAGQRMSEHAKGGDDTIQIGTIYSQWTQIGGDAGRDMIDNAKGGNDIITVDIMENGYVGGDAGHDMLDQAEGGKDSIKIATMKNGYVGGDAGELLYGQSKGGDDTIHITIMNNGSVGGDAGKNMSEDATGGNDSIYIGNMSQGLVGGDAGEYMTGNAKGGNDTIRINFMNGGKIAGDAGNTMNSDAKGGDDFIKVDSFAKGSIYGDAANILGNAAAGNDTIVIGNLTGTDQKYIYGDGVYGAGHNTAIARGNNIFVYDNNTSNVIKLNNDGSITIQDANGTDITTTTNTSIQGFSGIGGGIGNDTLEGNSGDNTFIISHGNDMVTGGGGKDVYVWNKDFQLGQGVTTVTDFAISGTEADKINLADLATDGDTIELNITQNGLRLSVGNVDFAELQVQGSFSLGNSNYTSYNDFYNSYTNADSTSQETMLVILMEQIKLGM